MADDLHASKIIAVHPCDDAAHKMTMIEKVTRAICKASGRFCGKIDGCDSGCQAPWQNHVHMGRDKEARAAIEAMRELNDEVREIMGEVREIMGAQARSGMVNWDDYHDAMIDAALNEHKG